MVDIAAGDLVGPNSESAPQLLKGRFLDLADVRGSMPSFCDWIEDELFHEYSCSTKASRSIAQSGAPATPHGPSAVIVIEGVSNEMNAAS